LFLPGSWGRGGWGSKVFTEGEKKKKRTKSRGVGRGATKKAQMKEKEGGHSRKPWVAEGTRTKRKREIKNCRGNELSVRGRKGVTSKGMGKRLLDPSTPE